MPSNRLDEARDYGFADRALALRQRAGLTQGELAALLGAGVRSVQAWEAALSYPGAERLQQLIALYLARGGFPAGQEEEEAASLWELARARAPRRIVLFDRDWFATLRSVADAGPAAALPPASDAPPGSDWEDVPDAAPFYGRDAERETLSRWLLADRCRAVAVLGAGGIGKTRLAARLAREVATQFTVVYWRSLRNVPPVEEWLAGAIAALSAQQALPPEGFAARLDLLLQLLRARRGLLVLDNLETILEPGSAEARYRAGYAGYGEVLPRAAESVHQSCLLLTGREAPPELPLLARERGPVRTLRLGGLGREAARALLQDRGLVRDEAALEALVARYGGNPLALNVVGETIGVVFGGEIAAFLAQEAAVFGGIRQLLDEQLVRLSALEQTVLSWLAVAREPVRFAELAADLGPGTERSEVVEAVAALHRRSLLERGEYGTFTLQPVVLEYVTGRLVETLVQEILTGETARLASQALIKACARDFVRRSQERLIAQPVLDRLRGLLDGTKGAERQLLALLDTWGGRPREGQGYGPGNVLNLIRLLRGDVRGLDFSRLTIRHAYLQEVDAQDASLAGAHLAEAVLGEAFTYPTALALSADGAFLATGTATGEVRLWQAADRTLLLAAQAHTGAVVTVALSADGRLMASGSADGTVRLWETGSGACLRTLQRPAGGGRVVALAADGHLLASGGADGTVRLWEAGSGRLLATLRGHTGTVRVVALSGDGRLVASGGLDGTVRLWETGSGRPLATLQSHTGVVWGVTLSGDGHLLASGADDGTVRLWEVASGRPLATLQSHTGAIWGVALSGDGHLVASGGLDGTVRLWEAGSGQPLATLRGHASIVFSVALSGDGRLVASGGVDGTVRLWETGSGRPLATLQGHTGAVRVVALSADGRLLASGGDDGTVRLWETGSGHPVAALRGHPDVVWGVTLSGDGHLVASGGLDGTVRLWEAGSGQPLAILQGHTGVVRVVALSGDGRLVASGGADGTVRLWEAPSGQPLATLHGHTEVVWGVALSGDGRLVASGGADGTVRLWEVRSGRCLGTLRGDRRYERMDITGLRGVTEAQRSALLVLGAVDRATPGGAAPGRSP